MRTGQSRRRDQTEGPIVHALRQVGASVMPLSGDGVPDLLVLFRGRIFLLEIKTGRGRVTSAQAKRSQEGWPVSTCRTINDALEAIGLDRLVFCG